MTRVNMILKPGERASIALPYRGNPSANFDWLKEVCGDRTRPQYDRASKRFRVARAHTQHVLAALVDEFSQVHVTIYGHTRTTCVEQCWNARPETIADCECGCAGANHGSREPMGRQVQRGLSVQHDLTSAKYKVTRQGWRKLP